MTTNTDSIHIENAIATSRIIGEISGTNTDGPTVVFFGGIHGNEPSGVQALELFFKEWETKELKAKGTILGIRGNIPALLKKRRFLDADLNRIWTQQNVDIIHLKNKKNLHREEEELLAIYKLIKELLVKNSPPFYFIDFHTTSSKTLPFITINDAMINRKFSRQFPVPVILGIEEFLEGPLLSYINRKGYVSLGFESGRHNTKEAVENSLSFIWLALCYSGVLLPEKVKQLQEHEQKLWQAAKGNTKYFEIIYRHALNANDDFYMLSEFQSFDQIEEGTPIAQHNQERIHAEEDTMIFMPLYQELGEDGFFLIRTVPRWALKLSSFLRRIQFDKVLPLLPGISWANSRKEELMVNLKTARFLSRPFFHLLGYRSRQIDATHMLIHNRERRAKNKAYQNTSWFQK